MISGGCTTCSHTVIIGVVSDVTFDGLGTPREAVFSPLTEGWSRQLYMFVRSTAPAAAIVHRLRDAVRAVDPSAAMESITSMDDEIYESLAQPRHWATILKTLGLSRPSIDVATASSARQTAPPR